MVIQTIRSTGIKLWWSAMFGLSSMGIDRSTELWWSAMKQRVGNIL